jgi:DNA invertase Pin-like site-specific DNA recombinase
VIRSSLATLHNSAPTAAGCEQIFVDKASGKLRRAPARRPELDKARLVAYRRDDQLVVTKLDRLGRSLADLVELSGASRSGRSAESARANDAPG